MENIMEYGNSSFVLPCEVHSIVVSNESPREKEVALKEGMGIEISDKKEIFRFIQISDVSRTTTKEGVACQMVTISYLTTGSKAKFKLKLLLDLEVHPEH